MDGVDIFFPCLVYGCLNAYARLTLLKFGVVIFRYCFVLCPIKTDSLPLPYFRTVHWKGINRWNYQYSPEIPLENVKDAYAYTHAACGIILTQFTEQSETECFILFVGISMNFKRTHSQTHTIKIGGRIQLKRRQVRVFDEMFAKMFIIFQK